MPATLQPITIDDVAAVMEAIARGDGEGAGFQALDALARRVFDHRLLTALILMPETLEVERLYSSNVEAYPVGGRKQKKGSVWGDKVLDRGEMHISHGPAGIRESFSDHALIASLGIEGMINIPIMLAGRCVGTVNISTAADAFTEADYPTAALIGGLALPLFLRAQFDRARSGS
jgi:hypothetical protein